MADGSVIIDTKLDTSGLQKMDSDIEAQLKKLEKQLKNIANDLTKALDSVDASGMVNEIKGGFREAETASGKSAENIENDLQGVETTANTTGEKVADEIKDGFRDAEKASEDGSEKIEDDLDDVGDKSKQTGDTIGSELSGAFKKVLAAVSVAEIAQELVEFGKECLELGSDLEEVQNVVDVTFETMSDAVNDFAKDAKKSAGLSEKMAKQYVGTFGAMADSFGFVETEAYEMSTALTQLSGDIASFYNISQDEAFTKLKSVFTGETEALKELGVVMTETALDAYAMANGFGKATSEMTEQEKVALRYQFVMDQLSSASGDFVRTQDSWANQCKILSLQWESLMATLGSGMIDALLPGIQFINDTVMPVLSEFAEEFAEAFEPEPSEELAKSLKRASKSAEEAKEQFQESSEAVERNAIMAEYYRDRLYELESAGINTAEAQAAYAGVVANLNELYPELNLQIDEQTGLLDDNSRAQLANIAAMKEKYFLMAVEEQVTAIYQAQANARKSLMVATQDLETVTGELSTAETQLKSTTSMSVEEMISLYQATELSAGVVQNMDGSVIALSADQMDLISQIISLRQEQENLEAKIEEGKTSVEAYDAELKTLYETYGIVYNASEEVAGAQEDITTKTQKTIDKIDTLIAEYNAAKDAARQSIDAQIGCFDEMVVKSDLSTEDIRDNWASQKQGFDEYTANLQKAIEMELDDALVQQLADGSVESMAILDKFVDDTGLDVAAINAEFKEMQQARDTVSGVMADIQTDTSKKLAEISEEMSTEWGDMADTVGAAISEAQSYIDSLTGKTVYNKVITQYSTQGSSSPGKTSSTTAPAVAAAVPFLAKGTVIPPNAPFMAVLGDQRHGTNVEAPLSTIQEAVALVMEDQTAAIIDSAEAIIARQERIISVIENIEVGDTTIGEAVQRYHRKQSVLRGGTI